MKKHSTKEEKSGKEKETPLPPFPCTHHLYRNNKPQHTKQDRSHENYSSFFLSFLVEFFFLYTFMLFGV